MEDICRFLVWFIRIRRIFSGFLMMVVCAKVVASLW
jgi:hypothetical protein